MDDTSSENSTPSEASAEPQKNELNGAPVNETLPPGETDPNVLYIAVGKAIHAWENMEFALARTFAAFNNLSQNPYELIGYGLENGMFNQRIRALENAARAYFIRHPDQNLEGEFAFLLEDAVNLAIKRHRIAHGYVSMWSELALPTLPKGTYYELTVTFKYRWAAPFYSMGKLKTDPVGINGAAIDADRQLFQGLHNRIAAFTDRIRPPS